MKYRYLVVVEKTENNFGAYAPDVPGCVGIGQSAEEAMQSFRESLQLYLETPNPNGNVIAPPISVAADFVEVDVDMPVSAAKVS